MASLAAEMGAAGKAAMATATTGARGAKSGPSRVVRPRGREAWDKDSPHPYATTRTPPATLGVRVFVGRCTVLHEKFYKFTVRGGDARGWAYERPIIFAVVNHTTMGGNTVVHERCISYVMGKGQRVQSPREPMNILPHKFVCLHVWLSGSPDDLSGKNHLALARMV